MRCGPGGEPTATGWSPSSSRPTPAACPRARSSFRAGALLPAGCGARGSRPAVNPARFRGGMLRRNGKVIDADGDGLPDCWEASGSGIDFDGDGPPISSSASRSTRTATASRSHRVRRPDPQGPLRRDRLHAGSQARPQGLEPDAEPGDPRQQRPVGVKSVREAFAAAPVPPLPAATHRHPTSPPGRRAGDVHSPLRRAAHQPRRPGRVHPLHRPGQTAPAIPAQAVDFDTIKAGNFGTATERLANLANPNVLNAKRLAFRYVLFAHNAGRRAPPVAAPTARAAREIGGDDAVITLGSFAKTTVNNVSHRRGTTDQQAGTFMHEFGHLLGFGHGGIDGVNCKPNYRSVMSYTRQFAGSPIPNRRLDYSRSEDPVLADQSKTGFSNEVRPERKRRRSGPTRASVRYPRSSPRRTRSCSARVHGLWFPRPRHLSTGTASTPTNQNYVSANINAGATAGCDGLGDVLVGHDDWGNVLYRASAAINFAGGETSEEMTSDAGGGSSSRPGTPTACGDPDGTDCGGLPLHAPHRLFPKRHHVRASINRATSRS